VKPRIGFLGTGWIGRHRMAAMLATGAIEAAAICDPSPEGLGDAAALAPDAVAVGSLEAMLALNLDGIVIATPSALHAAQSIQVLEAGAAVFCQKPLGRNAAETTAVVAAARGADRLLAVDLSYRQTNGMQRIKDLVRSNAIGKLFAIDVVFHNAYGPDKPWFYDRALSGGGCVIDLGVHLIDLALWLAGEGAVSNTSANLFAGGNRLAPGADQVEDYASAQFLVGDVDVRLACSWRLHAGRGAVIAASFYGSEGGASLNNIDGSFYDFRAERFTGTNAVEIADDHEEWGGRAAADWARRLAAGERFDPAADDLVRVAEIVDHIYAGGQA
jgi:predicted dehydrogenase